VDELEHKLTTGWRWHCRTQSYDLWIYNYNASVVVGYIDHIYFWGKIIFILKTRYAISGVINFHNAGVVACNRRVLWLVGKYRKIVLKRARQAFMDCSRHHLFQCRPRRKVRPALAK
jgi:hypothetical protein